MRSGVVTHRRMGASLFWRHFVNLFSNIPGSLRVERGRRRRLLAATITRIYINQGADPGSYKTKGRQYIIIGDEQNKMHNP
jgi:hypothetical protein